MEEKNVNFQQSENPNVEEQITKGLESAADNELESQREQESATKDQAMPTMAQLSELIKQLKEMLNFQESIWRQTQDEFGINDTHMRLIIDYNNAHRVVPEGVDEDKPKEWPEDYDLLNGLDGITEEKLIEIFGEDSNIFGVDRSQTIDRIKWAAQTYVNYMKSLFEFNSISAEYTKMIEDNEKATVQAMKDAIDKEEDPERKATLKKQLDEYFYFKNLDFLADAVDEKTANYIINAFKDQRKIKYMLDRTHTALKRIGVSEKFILEIAQFEKLYLDEKYHKQSNLLLVYFMNMIVFNKIDDRGPTRRKVISMVVNLDKYIRKSLAEDESVTVLKNVLALEDQFLGKIDQSVISD